MDDRSGRKNEMRITAQIVAAHLSNNPLDASKIPDLIRSIDTAISALDGATAPEDVASRAPTLRPAVAISQSQTDEYLVCLEDGRRLKMLKRHLFTAYGLTPEQYRTKWGLPADYPMVAKNYALRRREIAIDIGLGLKG